MNEERIEEARTSEQVRVVKHHGLCRIVYDDPCDCFAAKKQAALERLIRFERAEAVWSNEHYGWGDDDCEGCELRPPLIAAIEAIEEAQ